MRNWHSAWNGSLQGVKLEVVLRVRNTGKILPHPSPNRLSSAMTIPGEGRGNGFNPDFHGPGGNRDPTGVILEPLGFMNRFEDRALERGRWAGKSGDSCPTWRPPGPVQLRSHPTSIHDQSIVRQRQVGCIDNGVGLARSPNLLLTSTAFASMLFYGLLPTVVDSDVHAFRSQGFHILDHSVRM